MKGFTHTGVSIIFFCQDNTGRVLLHKRSKNCRDEHGKWDCGGGGLKFAEKVEDGLKREIKEEFGAIPKSFEFLGFRDVHREHEGKKTHWITLDFKVLLDPSEVKNNEPHKIEEIGWFSLQDFPSPLHSQFPAFLEQYSEKLF